jgi:hypothetical protein
MKSKLFKINLITKSFIKDITDNIFIGDSKNICVILEGLIFWIKLNYRKKANIFVNNNKLDTGLILTKIYNK